MGSTSGSFHHSIVERIERYPDGPIQNMFDLEAKGHPDGDGLQMYLLDRTPAASTLIRT